MKFFLVVSLLWVAQAHALTAKSYIAMRDDGHVLVEMAADDKRPIASIIKLVVAEAALQQDPQEVFTITQHDIRQGRLRSSPLKAGMRVAREDLIELTLVSSDNVAAIALGRELQLQSHFAQVTEPSGLDSGNVSTARQLAQLAKVLQDSALASKSLHARTLVGNKKNTNPLVQDDSWVFKLSKTGYTVAAGGCLLVTTIIAGETVHIAILGSRGVPARWKDLKELRTIIERRLHDR